MNLSVHRFAQLVAAATFLLLIAGALVTSHDAGLSVPDWPLSYGTLFPPMVGNIRYEHSHRLIAGTVGLLILALAVMLAYRESRPVIRRLGWCALGAVVTQAILGGITVLYLLPKPVSIAHACLAQTVWCLVIALAVTTSQRWQAATPLPSGGELRATATAATALLWLQLLLGAIMRHTHTGLSVHVAGAAAATIAVLVTMTQAWRMPRSSPLHRWGTRLAGLLLVQVGLGITTAWIATNILTRTAHVVTGAAVLGSALVLTLWAYRLTPPPARSWQARLQPYLELTKPRLTLLAVITAAIGFILGARGITPAATLGHALLGIALIGAAAAALNQYLERDVDALMVRTKIRPLPTARLTPLAALRFGVLLASLGLLELAAHVNALTAALGALTLVSYLFAYTPLKRVTPLCTLVGAIPGALPPVLGWAAARNALTIEAGTLFAIMFLWQLPHFLAIAWLYRDDYARAGLKMLTVGDADGVMTGSHIALYSAALLPVTLLPTLLGISGPRYFVGAFVLTAAFCACGIVAAIWQSRQGARRLFLASIAYLPLLLTLMTWDKPR